MTRVTNHQLVSRPSNPGSENTSHVSINLNRRPHDRYHANTPRAHRALLTGTIGALVDGIDLTQPLSRSETEFITATLAEHQVVFVPDQHLSAVELHGLAAQSGPLTPHPVDDVASMPEDVTTISDSATRPPDAFDWHSDLSWIERPPRLGFLNAVDTPPKGGDTIWASGFGMYERLGGRLQHICDDLSVVHRPSPDLIRSVRRTRGDAVAVQLLNEFPPVAHPMVRKHALTGRKSLWLSPLDASHIESLDDCDSDVLLDVLHRGIEDPDVQIRWRWRPGDVAIWDETSTCHRELGDHYPQPRTMRRCTVD